MKVFNHEGCRSGQCVWQAHGQACLIAREISDKAGYAREQQRAEDLLNEAARLMEIGNAVGIAPVIRTEDA